MPVLWQGPPADAALASLQASQRMEGISASEKQRKRPLVGGALGRRKGRGRATVGIFQTVALVLLPWLIFVLTTCLFLFSYEDFPEVVWWLVGLCGVLSSALAVAGAASPPGTPLLGLGVWCCTSLGMAVALGHSLQLECLRPFSQLEGGYHMSGVDPSEPLNPHAADHDVTVFEFAPDTFLDDLRTVGFIADGHVFCAAPVARHGKPSKVVSFWAVGVGCCEARSNFDCGTARLPGARVAVAYDSREDVNFQHAVELAASVHNTKSVEGARFVRFVRDPRDEQLAWRSLIVLWAGAAFLGHLLWTAILAVVADRLAKHHSAAVAQTMAAVEDDVLTAPHLDGFGGPIRTDPQLGAIPTDPRFAFDVGANDPFMRGGGPTPAKQKQEQRKDVFLPASSQVLSTSSSNLSFEGEHFFETVQEDPDFFNNVVIARDGGLSEVEDTFAELSWSDFTLGAVTPCFILYNVTYLLTSDWFFLQNADPRFDKMYLISTTYILEPSAHFLTKILGREEDSWHVRAQQMFAICEITGMVWHLVWLLISALRLPWDSEYKRWLSVVEIFWDTLPSLSTYSLMRCLGHVCPTVIAANFQVEISAILRDNVITAKEWGILLRFFFRHVCYAVIGFDAFLVKFRITSHFVTADQITLFDMLGAGNFVMQLVGVVRMGKLIQRRLFEFVFAGEDCVMDAQDEMRMQTYNALLAMKIWKTSKSWCHFSVSMLNFNDYDFQKLVLNMRSTATATPLAQPDPRLSRVRARDRETPDMGATVAWNWAWRSPPMATKSASGAAATTSRPTAPQPTTPRRICC